ncbi:rubrerythrin family protein [Pyrobaculum aerophilum]|uniref:VIT1/CCC1 transporter family protein n=1 Tax=Pyrobaculum aerophilum TaxID=13773 RepID=UPI002FD9C937
METTSNSKLVEVAREAALDEYKEYVTYSVLARVERNKARRAVLERLAEQEREHFQFWNKFAGVKPPAWRFRLYAYFMAFLRLILGVTFVAKLMERGEEEAIARYKSAEPLLSGPDREALRRIIKDEEEHERALIAQLDEAIVKYMGALVLGLADAIIEITGAHAGTLGTTNNTVAAGVIGLIVGVGAAISMASASYLQTKHEVGKSPSVAALVTGVGYIAAVALMSLPYFLIHDVYLAFAASIAVGVMLTFLLTFQSAVYADRDFKFEFLQTVGLLLGTAFLTYLLGEWLGSLFGIRNIL